MATRFIARRAIPATALALALLCAVALAVPAAASGAEPMPASEAKVAVIVGPVGDLSETYIEIAELAADAAEQAGATVARAYTPDASAGAVLAAVEGANIVVYLGHGVGVPNPYSDAPDPETVNGWGLQGEHARGDHSDSWQDGTLRYYGEAWLAANARPAPGWVMIYSNACYAPGAGEGFDEPATQDVAQRRVSGYSRAPLGEMGASAYFATDFYGGAAHLVRTLLEQPTLSFGEVFASEPRHVAESVTRLAHLDVPVTEVWLQRSAYFEGREDYWYAFAGDPTRTPAAAWAGTRAAAPGDVRWTSLANVADGHSY